MRRKIFSCLFWILVWEAVSRLVGNVFLLAGPVNTVTALVHLVHDSDFLYSILNTSLHILCGFAAGSAAGIAAAVIAHNSRMFQDLMEPLVRVIKTIPVVSFVILLLIQVGSRMLSFWIPVLVVFPVLYLNTKAGLGAADISMLEMTEVFDAGRIARIRLVYLPALRPYLLSAFSLSLGMCWKSGVAAEVIGQPLETIGNGLYRAKINLDTARLFAWTLVIVILSAAFEKAGMLILKKILTHRVKVCT